jgi:dihydroorotate dehydrogenase
LPAAETKRLVEVARAHNVQGFVCSNLTKPRNNPLIKDRVVPPTGGISGKVQQDLSDEQVRLVYRETGGTYLIVGCGGVFTAEDAYRKIRAGASLVQLITGMIFQGPQTISEINVGLVRLLKRDGYKNVAEAVGAEA